jgi:hypothetical protein
MKTLLLLAVIVTIFEIAGWKGLLHVLQNVIALFSLWLGLNLAANLRETVYPDPQR